MSENEKLQSPITNENTMAAKAPMDLRLLGALVRTAFSSEQTLMSWMRTSVSLFTFGFSVAKFFHYLEEQREVLRFSAGPRRLGLVLVGLGVFALVLATVEHGHRLRALQKQGIPRISQYLLPFGTSVVLLAIGIVAFISVYFG